MTMLLSPDNIRPNPYQTRTAEDPAHIAELAESIREVGLLQTPIARLRPHGQFAELAFGHSRLSAWKIARPGEAFPVEIRELSDRQMSDLAAEENARRKNLSAIETARAIQRRIADFGLTQLEAGKPFGYTSQGAVSNLLRLLKLPEPVQASVDAGELPERLARQLVAVAAIADGKDVQRVVKDIVKAPGDEREERLREGIFDLVDQHGQELSAAAFDLAWPGKPIPVTHNARVEPGAGGGADLDDLTELRACRGCPYLFRFEMSETCLRPECFALKQSLAIEQAITRAEKKLGVFKADPAWVVTPLMDRELREFGWDIAIHWRKLIGAKKNEQLGLCLVAYPQGGGWWFESVTGSRYVALATTNLPAVRKFLAPKDTPAAAAPDKPAPTTPAEVREQEDAERAERREQRARDLRLEHDIVWMVRHAAEWIGEQLEISGGILALVQDELEPQAGPMVSEFEGLREYREELERRLEAASSKAADAIRRQHLAYSLLLHECFESYMKRPMAEWRTDVEKIIRELATNGPRPADAPWTRAGLGVRPPPGWNKPPIHSTPYNCRHCGTFASSRKLTKRDQAEGWVAEMDGEIVMDVRCPKCASKAKGKTLATLFSDGDGHTNGNGHKPGLGVSTGKKTKRAKAKA
jgi:ParB/RepB/Spo0J family partition protein